MQFENFDNKIKEAAEQHHPTYDEMAWSKMEKLLNRHLPQKEGGRRRIIILFLLFLLLTGGGLWMIIDKPWQQERVSTATTPKDQERITPGLSSISSENENNEESDNPSSNNPRKVGQDLKNDIGTVNDPASSNDRSAAAIIAGANQQKENKPPVAGRQTAVNSFETETSQGGIAKRGQPVKDQQAGTDKTTGEKGSVIINPIAPVQDIKDDRRKDDNVAATGIKKDQPANDPVAIDKKQSETEPAKKNSDAEQAKPAEEKKPGSKPPVKKPNSFFFSFSAGPDVSSVGLDRPGEVKLLTGAGFGYTFRDRFTVRTGFYSVSKIYKAEPGKYKPAVPPPSPNYLKEIAADCKVYEIPLSLAYNFGRSSKYRTFASVGLSSFIMKSEEYDYWYQYPGLSPVVYYTHTEQNKNKHYFSVLSLSGGYQRRFSKVFSLTIEPYIKLPLAGVGYGKVNLNSAGILVSANISPFQPQR